MLTPATSASSTSSPRVMRSNASCTHVLAPPFLYWLPFADETTTGRASFDPTTAGAPAVWAEAPPAASTDAAAPVFTKSRRVTLGLIRASLQARARAAGTAGEYTRAPGTAVPIDIR